MNAKEFLDALEQRQGRPLTESEMRKAARMYAQHEAQYEAYKPAPDAPYPLDALNLDDMTIEDLEATERYLDWLHSYAANKLEAMQARQDGNIEHAKRAETTCQLYYDNLPPNWKW